MGDKRDKARHFVIVILLVALVFTVSFLLKVLFDMSINELTVEILAAVLAVVLVVASAGATIHFQNQSEIERGFRIELFRFKVDMYRKLLKCIAAIDDKEVEAVRNGARIVALVASPKLVETLAALVERLDKQRQLGSSADVAGTFRSVVQAMREDLDVVEGDVTDYFKLLVDK